MNINEKLEYFDQSVIDNATSQAMAIVEEYRSSLQKVLEERKSTFLNKAEHTYRMEADLILREKNHKLSQEAMEFRRKITEKSSEITEQIFSEVEKKLKDFMKTPAYEDFLCQKIKKVNELAQGHVVIIYINPTDEALKESLEKRCGYTLTISNRDFIGGIRAVIASRKILIDESFITKLSEEKEAFKLIS